ncbi:MAG: hypothetical protein Q9181_006523 [Wetmoreana brouardii]
MSPLAMDPPDRLQKLGQDAYKSKNFKAALHSFNLALSQAGETSTTILDNRAATHEKLGDLQAALKDGRRMVSMDRTSCAGYLRTGKILQLLKRDKIALEIYELGIRNASTSDPNFKVLHRLRDRMSRTAKDPLAFLPTEIAKMIMECLVFEQLVHLPRVSKRWREFLQSIPSLWTRLDFSNARRSVPQSAVQQYIRHSQRRVTDVLINHRLCHWDSALHHIVKECPRLVYLQLDNLDTTDAFMKTVSLPKNLQSLVLSERSNISLACVSRILDQCPNLIRAEFHRMDIRNIPHSVLWPGDISHLRVLTLHCSGYNGVRKQNIGNLLKKIPDIQEISLTHCDLETPLPTPGSAEMNQLRRLRLNNCQGLFFPEGLPSLRTLELVQCGEMLRFLHDQEPEIRTVGFTEIAVPLCFNLHIEHFFGLVGSRTEELRKVNIAHCFHFTELALKTLVDMGLLDQVVDLDLSGTKVTDEVVESLVLRSHQLGRINLYATKITGVAVKALITKPDNKLNYLDIRDCNRISADAVAFARATKGLTVQCSSSDIKRGKKTRFG